LLKRFHIIAFAIVLSFTIRSQTNCNLTLKGVVNDNDNSEHLSFAIVQLVQTGQILQTDEHGRFSFSKLCAGNYQVLFKHAGCKDTLISFELYKNRSVQVKMPHSFYELQDVDVAAERIAEKSTQQLQQLDLKALDKTKGGSLGDQLKAMNGVTTLNMGATISKPMINGMQGYRILILNNGIRQEGQQWGNEHAPEIDPFIANRLTVVRGASAVRYGSDAVGGVVLVDAPPLPDSASVSGEVNLVGVTNGRSGISSGYLQGYFDKLKYFSWRIQGTLKKSGNLKTPNYFLKNTGVEEQNGSYALGYHRKKIGLDVYYSVFQSKIGIFSSAHIGNLTDLKAAFNRAKPADSLAEFSYAINRPYQNIIHELVKGGMHVHTGLRSRLYANYAYQFNLRQEFDKHLPRNNALAALNKPELDYRIRTHTGELIWEHDNIRSFRGKYGVQGLYQENVYEGRFFIPAFVNKTIGVFALERFVQAHYEIEGGVRYDRRDLTSYYWIKNDLQRPNLQFQNMSYNLGGIYKLDSTLNLSLNFANGWRAPSVNELYTDGLHHGIGAIERGDKNLKTEYCNNLIGGMIWKHTAFRVEASAYSYWFKNYIYYSPSPQPELTIRGAFPVFNYVQNNARIAGADVLFQYQPISMLTLKTRAMWVRGTNTETNQALVYMPADRYEVSIALNAKDVKHFKNSYLESTLNLVDKQYRVPDSVDVAPPPPAYYLLGFNIGTTVLIKKQAFIITLSITNALNTVYRDYLDRFRYYSDAPGTSFIFKLRMPFTLYNKSNHKLKTKEQ
jgi:iron complex outermembrane recepter protein